MARQGTERVHRVRPQAMFALKTSCENFDNTVFPNAMIAGDCVITHLLGRLDYLKTGKCKVMVVDTFHLFDETMPFLASIEKEYGFKAEIFGPVDVLPIQPIYYPSTTRPPPHISHPISRATPHPSLTPPPGRRPGGRQGCVRQEVRRRPVEGGHRAVRQNLQGRALPARPQDARDRLHGQRPHPLAGARRTRPGRQHPRPWPRGRLR